MKDRAIKVSLPSTRRHTPRVPARRTSSAIPVAVAAIALVGTLHLPGSASATTCTADSNCTFPEVCVNEMCKVPETDVAVGIMDSPDPVVFSQGNITYQIGISNLGSERAPGVVVFFSLTNGTVVSAMPDQGTCGTSSTSGTCGLGEIPPGGMATVLVLVTPLSLGTTSITAGYSANVIDSVSANNTAMESTTVIDTATNNCLLVKWQVRWTHHLVEFTQVWRALVQNRSNTEKVARVMVEGHNLARTIEFVADSPTTVIEPGAEVELLLMRDFPEFERTTKIFFTATLFCGDGSPNMERNSKIGVFNAVK